MARLLSAASVVCATLGLSVGVRSGVRLIIVCVSYSRVAG